MYLSLKVEGMSLWFFCWHMLQSVGSVKAKKTTLWHSSHFAQTCQEMLPCCITNQKTLANSGQWPERQLIHLLFSLVNEESLEISIQCNSWKHVCWLRVLMPPVLVKDNFLLSSLQLLLRFMPSPLLAKKTTLFSPQKETYSKTQSQA